MRFLESWNGSQGMVLLDGCKRQFKSKCDFVDFDSDEYLKAWKVFKHVFHYRDKYARKWRLNPDSLIDAEALYLVSRTCSLDFFTTDLAPNSPVTMQVLY